MFKYCIFVIMSKANEAIERKDTFLQHVSLKNYKSIKDIEVDFLPGLNIIIGKNGSGKTNLVKSLNNILNFKYAELPDSKSKIEIKGKSQTISLESRPKSLVRFSIMAESDVRFNHQFKLNIKEKETETNKVYEIINQLRNTNTEYRSNLISHGIPFVNTEFLQIPSSLTITSYGAISGGMTKFADSDSVFIKQYFSNLFLDIAINVGEHTPLDKDYIQYKVSNSNHVFRFLNSILKFYSPITEVQINPDFRIEYNDFNNEIVLTNFSFQFKVFDTWQPFNFLSDGTKRLFYIISEIAGLNFKYEPAIPDNTNFDIIFLEEPELGIHPHQLHQLMLFIKEQSKEKQIIITTHSPQVLDVLSQDELNRMIICHYDSKNGTQLTYLSDQQIKKAKKYMSSEAFLSDYWRFSDLEPA
jgi:predicted ATPase